MERMRSVVGCPPEEQVLKGHTHSSDVVIAISALREFYPFRRMGPRECCALSEETMLPLAGQVTGPLHTKILDLVQIC